MDHYLDNIYSSTNIDKDRFNDYDSEHGLGRGFHDWLMREGAFVTNGRNRYLRFLSEESAMLFLLKFR